MEPRLSKKKTIGQRVTADSNYLESDSPDTLEAQQTVACIQERFREGVQQLEEERNAIYERAAQETVKLALAIAQKVINHEVSINPEKVLGVVRKAMQNIKNSQSVCIRVHPQGFETLKQAELGLPGKGASFKGFEILADNALAPGDCFVETRQENIDASIQNQLAVIEEAFSSL